MGGKKGAGKTDRGMLHFQILNNWEDINVGVGECTLLCVLVQSDVRDQYGETDVNESALGSLAFTLCVQPS